MAKTWRFTNTDADLVLAINSDLLADIAVGSILLEASSGGGTITAYWLSPLGVSLVGQSNTGTFTVVLNVSTAASNTDITVNLRRYNSSAVQQASVAMSPTDVSGATTGDKTFTVTNPALGTWATGDRFVVAVIIQNNNAHGGAVGPEFSHTATNARVDTPFSFASVVTVSNSVDALFRKTLSVSQSVDALTKKTLTKTHSIDANLSIPSDITPTVLAQGVDDTNASTYTASVAFTQDKWVFAFVQLRANTTQITPNSVSSTSFTLTQFGSTVAIDPASAQDATLSLWRIKPSSTGTETVTIDATGLSATGATWHFIQWEGVDGTEPIDGSLASDAQSSANSISATLAAFNNSNDRPVAFAANPGQAETITPEGGYSTIGAQQTGTAPNGASIVFWNPDTQDTTPSASWTTANGAGILALKLKAASEAGTQTKTHSIDSLLNKTLTTAHSIDSLILKTQVQTHSLDSLLNKTQIITHSVDALLRTTLAAIQSVDSLLLKQQAATHSIDANIQNVVLKTQQIDSLLLKIQTQTHSIDALLNKTLSQTHQLDALILKTQTQTHSIDSLLDKTQTQTHSLDSLLNKTLTKTHELDASLLKTQAQAHSIDASLRKTLTVTNTIDSLILKVLTQSQQFDALIQKTQSVSHSIDTNIIEGQQTLTKTHEVDALILKTLSQTHSIDSLVLKAQTQTHLIDALVQKTFTKDSSVDSLLLKIQEKTQSIDSLVLKSLAQTHQIDALVLDVFVVTHSVEALLQKQQTQTHQIDALITSRFSVQNSVDAKIIKRKRMNTLEGGTDEVTITTGNSGGDSGDAFDGVVF